MNERSRSFINGYLGVKYQMQKEICPEIPAANSFRHYKILFYVRLFIMKMQDINILAEKILYSAETDGEELCKSILENYDFFHAVCGILREENARALIQ